MSVIQNLLPVYLTIVVAFNASCACGSIVLKTHTEEHSHHQTSDQIPHSPHCSHSDCPGDCEQAVGAFLDRNATQTSSFKFSADEAEMAVLPANPSIAANGFLRITGPPFEPAARFFNTPVGRRDLQLE